MFSYAGLLPLQDRVHANRLRFLARLLHKCPPITWQLINAHTANGSWHALCLQSCAWFLQHYDRPLSVGSSSTLHDWIQHIALDTRWKGRIRKATELALAFHRSTAEHIVWQRHVYASLRVAGLSLPSSVCAAVPSERWQCDLCAKAFASSRALAMHASREHGYRKRVRFYASGDTCPVCCQLFHTRQRLSIHLEKNARLYDVVQQCCWPPMPAELVQSLDAADQKRKTELRKNGWWASKAFEPVRQTVGALLPPLHSPEAKLMYRQDALSSPTRRACILAAAGTPCRPTPTNWAQAMVDLCRSSRLCSAVSSGQSIRHAWIGS